MEHAVADETGRADASWRDEFFAGQARVEREKEAAIRDA